MEKYDIIIQNNATKQTYVFKTEDTSGTYLYHEFDVDMDVPEGEYTYVVLRSNRKDVEYEFKVPVNDTIVRVGDEEWILRDFQPLTGLMRIGDFPGTVNVYDKNNENTNDTIYYE